MKDKIDENFARSLLPYALSITRGKGDPWDLVIGAFEYLKKNEEKYKNHPNIKAIAHENTEIFQLAKTTIFYLI